MNVPDLLWMLLSAQDEETGEGMSDQQLRDEVLTLLLAGHETTAAALTWTWYLLSQHPEVERRLHAELDSVLAGRLPTVEHLDALPYTRMVIQEAQLVLATVAQRYCLRLVPGHPVEPQVLLTLRPRYGLPMTLLPRLQGTG